VFESRKYFFLNRNRHYKENVVESVIKLVSLGEGYLPHWKPLDTYIRLVSGDTL